MDFTPTEEQDAVRDLASTLMTTAVHDTPFDEALWQRLVEAGFLGLSVAEEHGGGGLGLTELALVAEEAGRAAARTPLLAALGGIRALAAAGAADLLAPAVSGEQLVVPALGAAGVEDPRRPLVRATRAADGLRLTGERVAVAWARQAARLVVAATDADGEVLLAVVDTDAPGVTLLDEVVTSGEPHATVVLEDAPAALLADGPQALEAALRDVTLLHCAHATGVAEDALRRAAEHLSGREQFGRPLATFQALTVRMADCWIDVASMRATLQQAVWKVDSGLPAEESTAVAAFWAAEGGQRVVGAAVHLHGGLGVDVTYPVHRYFLAGKVDELSLGGPQRQLERLGALLAAH